MPAVQRSRNLADPLTKRALTLLQRLPRSLRGKGKFPHPRGEMRRARAPTARGSRSRPSYVGEPECKGVIERFMRTLKEHCLYLHRFQTLEEARRVIAAFIDRYNHEWLIERLGHRTPAQDRTEGWRAGA
jgi:transposase InsO family protein